MGRKGVISSHATLYSRTERKRATQIAARSTVAISWETSTPPLPRTLCEPTVLSTCWSVRKGGSLGSLYEAHPWLFTLFSIKLHQEKVWHIRSYDKYWSIFFIFDTLKAIWTGRTVLHTRFIKQYWCNLEEIGIMRQFAEKQHIQINCITHSVHCNSVMWV